MPDAHAQDNPERTQYRLRVSVSDRRLDKGLEDMTTPTRRYELPGMFFFYAQDPYVLNQTNADAVQKFSNYDSQIKVHHDILEQFSIAPDSLVYDDGRLTLNLLLGMEVASRVISSPYFDLDEQMVRALRFEGLLPVMCTVSHPAPGAASSAQALNSLVSSDASIKVDELMLVREADIRHRTRQINRPLFTRPQPIVPKPPRLVVAKRQTEAGLLEWLDTVAARRTG